MVYVQSKTWYKVLIFVFSLIALAIWTCGCGSECQSVSLVDFDALDLVGTWEAHYTYPDSVDKLVFKEDGTYQQIYDGPGDYLHVSSWNEWRIEYKEDGRVWIYLENGRWFPEGPEIAELEGMDPFRPETVHHFYDHAANKGLTMPGRLTLDVRPWTNSKGFVLMHFAYDIDSGTDRFGPTESRP